LDFHINLHIFSVLTKHAIWRCGILEKSRNRAE